MRISAQITGIIAAIFAVACYGVAITGFTSLGEITDPQGISDAKGFAWFWAFLGTIGALFCAVSFWMAKGDKEHRE